MGEPNVDLLNQVLQSDEPLARAAAVRVLRWWLQDIDDPFSPLQRAALDGDARVRTEVIYALGFLLDSRSLEILSLAMRQPVDDDSKGTLHRTVTALQNYGEVGGEGTEALPPHPHDRCATFRRGTGPLRCDRVDAPR